MSISINFSAYFSAPPSPLRALPLGAHIRGSQSKRNRKRLKTINLPIELTRSLAQCRALGRGGELEREEWLEAAIIAATFVVFVLFLLLVEVFL